MWKLFKGYIVDWLVKAQLLSIVAWFKNAGFDIDQAVPPVQGEVRFPLYTRLYSAFMGQLVSQAQQIQHLNVLIENYKKAQDAANEQFEELYREAYPLMNSESRVYWRVKAGEPSEPARAPSPDAAPATGPQKAVDPVDAASAAGVGSGA